MSKFDELMSQLPEYQQKIAFGILKDFVDSYVRRHVDDTLPRVVNAQDASDAGGVDPNYELPK